MTSLLDSSIDDSGPVSPLVLAQVAAEDVELTVGGGLAVLLVLGALSGSLIVLNAWIGRWRGGKPLMPFANRTGTRIPMPLMMFGILVAVFMCSMAILGSINPPESSAADVTMEPESVSVEPVDSTGDSVIEAAPTDSRRPAMSKEQFRTALIQTVYLDLVLMAVLGIPVWRLQREQRRTDQQSIIDSPFTVDQEYSAAAATDEWAADEMQAAQSPDDMTADSLRSDPVLAAAAEPWRLPVEFRFAAEACLAAWLPTAALRLITVFVFQNETQHPFLEMMDSGVGAELLLLIAATAVIFAPLMEELLYRVVILGGLLNGGRSKTPAATVIAIGVTSVLFAFAHGFPDSLALLPLSVVICWTYHQRRSYRTVVLVHFLFNGFNILLAGLSML